jgi:hypothetical protein
MANTSIPKSWYQVFECRSQGMFDYDETKVLCESDSIAVTHSYAYKEWLASGKTKVYTIIQPYDGSCRGGYGFPDE